MGGIEQLAETVATDMEQRLPGQRKTQRGKLALLVATMLQVRSANLMDVAACLPRPAERLDSRYHTGSGRWTRIEDSWVVEQRVGWCALSRGGEPWRGLLII